MSAPSEAAASQPEHPVSRPYLPPPGAFYPPVLPYREGQPIPNGYRLEESSNGRMAIGGAATFLLAYGAGLVLAATNGFDNGAGWMAAPLVGPWAAIAVRENPCRTITVGTARVVDRSCINDALDEALVLVLFTVDGLVQTTGAALFVVGMVTKNQQLVRHDVAGITVGPRRFGEGGYGLQASGRF